MKILSSVIAILAVVCSVFYFAGSSTASTAAITYVSPVGSLGAPVSVYEFSATSGSAFDVELSASSSFTTLIESLTNQTDANGMTPNIEINSSKLSSLEPGTYFWRARINGGSFVDGTAQFQQPSR